MIEYLGWIATTLFVSAMAAQAVKSYKDGHARDISHLLIWQCGLGYVMMAIYTLDQFGWDWVLMTSYILQTAFLGVVVKYKYWPRQKLNMNFRRKGDVRPPGIYGKDKENK